MQIILLLRIDSALASFVRTNVGRVAELNGFVKVLCSTNKIIRRLKAKNRVLGAKTRYLQMLERRTKCRRFRESVVWRQKPVT